LLADSALGLSKTCIS